MIDLLWFGYSQVVECDDTVGFGPKADPAGVIGLIACFDHLLTVEEAADVIAFGGLSTASVSKLYVAIWAMAVEPTSSRTTIQRFRFIPSLPQRTFIILGYNRMG
jgi:hypothetical protein